MKFLTIFSLLLSSGWFFAQESIDSIYANGIFNGHYESYYPNGQKKASGDFINNQRIGEWKLWDSTGVLRMRRHYVDNLNFEITLAISDAGEHITELEGFTHYSTRSESGLMTFDTVQIEDVRISKRLWIIIDAESLEINFFQIVLNDVKENGVDILYDPEFDDFRNQLSIESLDDYAEKDITAYKIKEDWFYDTKRHMSEIRMIGICPVSGDEKENDLFWLFYPHLRGILSEAGENDDQLVSRNFSSIIIKESNVNNRSLSEYESDLVRASKRITSELLDVEHSEWLRELK